MPAVGYILSLIMLILPLVFIPFAFKIAGGIIGRVHEAIDGFRSKGQEKIKERLNNENGAWADITRRRERAQNRAVMRAGMYNRGVARGGVRGAVLRGIGGRRSAEIEALHNKEAGERVGNTAQSGNDTYIRASTLNMDALRNTNRHRVRNGVEEFEAATGQWFTAAQIRAGHDQYRSAADMQTAFRIMMSKTENADPAHQQMILQDFENYANTAGMSAEEASGNWAGIAIPNQRMRADLRYSSFSGEEGHLHATSSSRSLVQSMGTQQGFAMATQGEGNFEALTDAYSQQMQQWRADTAAANDMALRPEDRAAAATRRDETANELHNARENLRKFVGSRGTALPRPDEEGGGVALGSNFGGASSASYKTEQAAQAALNAIDAMDPPSVMPGVSHHDDYSGGRGSAPGDSIPRPPDGQYQG